MMVLLGESIIQLVETAALTTGVQYLVFLLFIATVFNLAAIYFDNQPFHPTQHALSGGTWKAATFVFAHLFLGFAILCFGVGIKIISLEKVRDTVPDRQEDLLAISLGTVLLLMTFIRILHCQETEARVLRYAVGICAGVFLVVVPPVISRYTSGWSLLGLSFTFWIITSSIVTTDVWQTKEIKKQLKTHFKNVTGSLRSSAGFNTDLQSGDDLQTDGGRLTKFSNDLQDL